MDGADGMPKRKKPKTASLQYEKQAYADGYHTIIGIDEAGRGAWAGPVMAGAVCLPEPIDSLSHDLAGVRDSKEMTARQRGLLAEKIRAIAITWGVGSATHNEVDTHGLIKATKLAMSRALEVAMQPGFMPDLLLLDAMKWDDAPVACAQKHILGGDKLSLSIAAASVLAKTERDAHMIALDEQYPDYMFGKHKGYGTKHHREALAAHGVSAVHRRTYKPILRYIEATHDP